MKKIVVYHSKTGFTEKYAQWIAEALNCRAVSAKEYLKTADHADDIVIYGGGLIAGKISGLDKIKKQVGNQSLIVFATGATSQNADHVIADIQKNNLTEAERSKLPFYYLESGICYEQMNFASEKMLKMMRRMLEKKADINEEEAGMLKALQASSDKSSKAYIQPLINKVQELEKG